MGIVVGLVRQRVQPRTHMVQRLRHGPDAIRDRQTVARQAMDQHAEAAHHIFHVHRALLRAFGQFCALGDMVAHRARFLRQFPD